MRKLFITAIVFGLAVAPAAFARGGHDQDGKSGQSEKSDHAKSGKEAGPQGGNSAGHISDQGRANTNGPNASPRLHGQDRANARRSAQGLAHSNAFNAKRDKAGTRALARSTEGMATTRNAANFERKRNVANTDRVRNAVVSDRTPKTFVKTRPAEIMALRRNVQSPQRFHAGSYRQPYGYHSRHWSFGQRLPSIYFVSDYWINDYLTYALFAPSDGLVWVRVGDDALLIDRYTGEIIRVEYSVFY